MDKRNRRSPDWPKDRTEDILDKYFVPFVAMVLAACVAFLAIIVWAIIRLVVHYT